MHSKMQLYTIRGNKKLHPKEYNARPSPGSMTGIKDNISSSNNASNMHRNVDRNKGIEEFKPNT